MIAFGSAPTHFLCCVEENTVSLLPDNRVLLNYVLGEQANKGNAVTSFRSFIFIYLSSVVCEKSV